MSMVEVVVVQKNFQLFNSLIETKVVQNFNMMSERQKDRQSDGQTDRKTDRKTK